MAIKVQVGEKDPVRIAQALRELADGRANNVGDVTLAVSPATTTVVSFPNCSTSCRVVLEPQTAHAAALKAGGAVYIKKSDILNGQFTITHPASANVDNNFSFFCIGG